MLDVIYFRNKKRSPRTVINQVIPDEKIRILDLCCGTLANSIPVALCHKKAKILGVDISKKMLQVAQKKRKKSGVSNIVVKQLDATNTALPQSSFDYVMIGLALHEMSPELKEEVLAEAYRLLKEDGTLIVLEWEKPELFWEKVVFAPLYVGEQLLCGSFKDFYQCNKTDFFHKMHSMS